MPCSGPPAVSSSRSAAGAVAVGALAFGTIEAFLSVSARNTFNDHMGTVGGVYGKDCGTGSLSAACKPLKQDYDRPGGLQIVEVAGGYQIVTRPELHEWVRRLFQERTTQKLSVAALETLAANLSPEFIAVELRDSLAALDDLVGARGRRPAAGPPARPADRDRKSVV